MSYREAIDKHFPGAVQGKELTDKVNSILKSKGLTPDNTLFANSTCPDELNRVVTAFGQYWGENFTLGGLAGYPFTGKTGFAAYSHHIEPDGYLFILHASHVGVSKDGEVGKITRKRMNSKTSSCGSGIGAYKALSEDINYKHDSGDQQQAFIVTILKDNWERISESADPLVEVPNVIYDSIHGGVKDLVPNDYNCVLLGGIQINTPIGEPDYFLVKNFEFAGKKHRDLMDEL